MKQRARGVVRSVAGASAVVGVVGTLTLLLPNTGSASSEALDTMPMDELYALAQDEGTFTMYGAASVMEVLYPLFAERYPGISMEQVDVSDEDLVVRADAEMEAGEVIGDVWQSQMQATHVMFQRGLVIEWNPPEAESFELRGSYWVGTEMQPKTICWNTDAVADEDAPATWEDLADPKYVEYAIGLDPDGWIVLLAYAEEKFDGDLEAAEAVFRGIAENQPIVGSGGRALVNSLAAGEFDINMNCSAHIFAQLLDEGAPLAMTPVESVENPIGTAPMTDAPHPAAAMLYSRWLLTEDAQQALAEMGRIPGHRDVPAAVDLGTETVYFVEPDVVAASAEEYAQLWNEIFGIR